MSENKISDSELESMLLSGNSTQLKNALLYIYQSEDWKNRLLGAIASPPSFFKANYNKLIASLKIKLVEPKTRNYLKRKGLSLFLRQLWREYVGIFVEDEDLLKMFQGKSKAAGLAMEICYQRFRSKIYASLLKIKSDENAVEEVVQDTFLNVFKTLMKKKADFKLQSTLEAYFMSSCKYAYWRYWNNNRPLDNEKNLFEWEEAWEEMDLFSESISAQKEKCFEEKIFPKLGDTCKKILCMVYLGHKNAEIAEALNYTDGSLRKQKSLCMTKAKALAKEYCKDL